MKPNDAAFPSAGISVDQARQDAYSGLTKREYIAIHLMAGFLSNPYGSSLAAAAEDAVEAADALSKALSK